MPNLPNLPIPENLTPETFCLCLQIPNDPTWKQAFVNLLAIPTYWFNWDRDEARSGRELAAYWTTLFDQIDWSTMSCCCNQPPIIFRITGDGVLQMSTDGGSIWTDAPGYDPRLNSPQFPPIPGEDGNDKKCVAATGAALLIRQQVGDELTDDMSQYTLAEVIRDWENTVINDGGNILDGLLRLAANQVFALGVSVLRAALTDTVYDTLKCILFCRIAANASFNAGAVAAVEGDITSQIGGIAGLFLNHLVDLLGPTGLTNLARAGGAATGDCSGCGCTDPCDGVNFLLTNGGWDNIPRSWGNPAGAWTLGDGWRQTYQADVHGNNELHIESPIYDCAPGDYDVTVTLVVDTYYSPNDVVLKLYMASGWNFTTHTGTSAGSFDVLFDGVTFTADDVMDLDCTSNASDYRITNIAIVPHV